MMKNGMKKILFVMLLASSAMIAGCSGNVGIGLNVGVPIGNHGYMSVGTNRWL
jgi:predicted small secreted protein